jgi:prepilin-type N-terminal cleavage/methylation domain-containing protein
MDVRRSLSRQDGFTLVEVMVASVITLVGMVGTATMVDHAASGSTSTRAREGAVNLQRELVEAARSVPYEALAGTGLVARVQVKPALGDGGLGAGWTIRRRGVTYTVSMGACAVDDPRDGVGSHQAGVFCASGANGTTAQECRDLLGVSGLIQGSLGAVTAGVAVGDCGLDVDLDGAVDGLVSLSATVCGGTCGGGPTDTAPADYKRVVVLVRWDRGDGSRWSLQSTTLPNPGLSGAPSVTSLTDFPAEVTAGTSLSFSAATSTKASAVTWAVDGTQHGTAAGADASWSFSWPLGTVASGSKPNADEVLDGSYVIGAKAFDAYGQFGFSRSTTVVVNRRVPYPVQQLVGGRNGSAVDFEWAPPQERDIVGYRVYRQPTLGAPVLACTSTGDTGCRDTAPPGGLALVYYAVALDADPQGTVREGQPSSSATVTTGNRAPNPPANLTATTSGGAPVLSWTAPAVADPDLGDAIDHYVIYRDGTAYADRYDRTPTGTDLTFTDTRANGTQHTYSVAAIDTQLAQSTLVGPVTR